MSHRDKYYEKFTLVVINNVVDIKEPILCLNLPTEISRLQDIFIESFTIAVLAVY